MNSQHFHFQHHIDIPYLLLDMFLSHYIWVYQDTWLYHNHHQWIHYYTHNTRYCQYKCHCHYMLSHHHIQLKTINYYLSGIEEIYQLKTYSSFLGWLHHPGSNFQRYRGHQYQSQCKGTLLDCLNLQSSSQQLNWKKDNHIITLLGEKQRKYTKYQRPVITVYIFTVWQWCFFF